MGSPVDVLAVLDIEIGAIPNPRRPKTALREARAAVAELIEAAAVTLAEPWEIHRLRDALARCTGATP